MLKSDIALHIIELLKQEPGARVYTFNTLMNYRKPVLEAWMKQLMERKKKREELYHGKR